MRICAAKYLLLPALLTTSAPVWSGSDWPASAGEPTWQPATDWDASTGLFSAGDVPGDYDPVLLTLGRSIYIDLQRARQAVLQKHPTNLKVALLEARDDVHRLRLPAGVMALDAQLQVIRHDLQDAGKQPDASLWVAVEAEINRVLVYAPVDTGNRVREAVHNGRLAASRGDALGAKNQLDLVADSMQYSLGMFPLNQVRTDLTAALRAATQRPAPDWDGALDAVQDALATFHWYTQKPAYDLLAAQHDLMKGYTLARGMYADPEKWRQAREYLLRAQHRLERTPGGWSLAELTRDAIYEIELHRSDAVSATRYVFNALQSEIQQQRRQAERRYRRSIGQGT